MKPMQSLLGLLTCRFDVLRCVVIQRLKSKVRPKINTPAPLGVIENLGTGLSHVSYDGLAPFREIMCRNRSVPMMTRPSPRVHIARQRTHHCESPDKVRFGAIKIRTVYQFVFPILCNFYTESNSTCSYCSKFSPGMAKEQFIPPYHVATGLLRLRRSWTSAGGRSKIYSR